MRSFLRCVSFGMALFMALSLTPAMAASPTSEPVITRLEAPGIVRGGCSGPSRWRLTVRREARAFRVTLVVRGGPADQRWNIFIDHDGRGFFAGSRVSNANGAVGVRRSARDRRGVDRFRFGANGKHGESCSGRARA